MRTLTVLVAPDSFKGTATAVEIAESIRAGWLGVRPDDRVDLAPMADGGEGTLDVFAQDRPSTRHRIAVPGADGVVRDAEWLEFTDTDGRRTGFVELASTSGIAQVAELVPLSGHSRGFGAAVRAALEAGVRRLVLSIGSSASTDGGSGLLAELGAEFLDRDGAPVRDGNEGLGDVHTVRLDGLAALPPDGVLVLTDVTNPLLGERGAVAVFGPQKGIGADLAADAEQRMAGFAALLGDAAGAKPAEPGAGAAGGVGFALLAWGARLVAGSEAVADEIGLPAAVRDADVVITGEGRYDGQSEDGKVAGHVRSLARQAGARCALVAGLVQHPAPPFDESISLTTLAGGSEQAMADPRRWAEEAGRRLAGSPAWG
jgi:glycerate 2-kinase